MESYPREKQMNFYDTEDIDHAVNALIAQRPDPGDVMEILKARDIARLVQPIKGGHGVVPEDRTNYHVVKTEEGYRCDCGSYPFSDTGRCVHTVAVEICNLIDQQRP